jgi:hypothetical protein
VKAMLEGGKLELFGKNNSELEKLDSSLFGMGRRPLLISLSFLDNHQSHYSGPTKHNFVHCLEEVSQVTKLIMTAVPNPRTSSWKEHIY